MSAASALRPVVTIQVQARPSAMAALVAASNGCTLVQVLALWLPIAYVTCLAGADLVQVSPGVDLEALAPESAAGPGKPNAVQRIICERLGAVRVAVVLDLEHIAVVSRPQVERRSPCATRRASPRPALARGV
jgi:hypothetical protein